MTAELLVLDDVRAGYTDEPIVAGVSLSIASGTITTIIGGNGAGKSTLLKTIYGLTRHMGGSIRFQGAAIERLDPRARLALGIGLVPQGRCNFPVMTVRENLEMGAFTLPRAQARAAFERAVETFPLLRGKLAVLAGNLSGGEQ